MRRRPRRRDDGDADAKALLQRAPARVVPPGLRAESLPPRL